MALYNLRSSDGDWRITKFTNDLDVESSYLVSRDACECPAGHRPSCRHRQMLPRMLAAQAEDSPMFYDFDNDRWLAPTGSPEIIDAEPMADGQTFSATDEASIEPTFTESKPSPASSHPQGTIRRRL